MSWLRWWTGTVNDPKWRLVARRANSKPGNCVAVWAYLLELAKPGEGNVSALDVEECAVVLDYDIEEVERIISAMRDRSLLDGDQVTSWEKRQPRREDDSAARVAAYRAKKREETQLKQPETACNAAVTQCNAPETETDTETETDVTDGKPSEQSARGKPAKPQDRSDKQAKAEALLADFTDFWTAYPNKSGKPVASKAYLAARLGQPVHGTKRNPAEHAAIMAGLSRYIASKPPDRSWLNPSTFLNQERYNDEPSNLTNPNNTAGRSQSPPSGKQSGSNGRTSGGLLGAVVRNFAERGEAQGSGLHAASGADWRFDGGEVIDLAIHAASTNRHA